MYTTEDIPREIFDKIKDLSISNNTDNDHHGLISRHGFIAPVRIKSSIPSKCMKTRISLLQEKNPELLTQKELKQMYLYKYLKSHKNDGHGISNDVWRKLKYGNFRKNPNNNIWGRKIDYRYDLKKQMEKYNELKNKIKSQVIPEAPVPENNNNEVNNEHGMPKSTWKAISKPVRRKLKKYGFSRFTEINPAFLEYITKKVDKKKLKKGVKNSL